MSRYFVLPSLFDILRELRKADNSLNTIKFLGHTDIDKCPVFTTEQIKKYALLA